VYAFPPLGVQPLRAAYRYLVDQLNIDAVVLVDGGTDVLLRGDESDLGTPVEDITSLAAVAALDVPVKLVTSLGFGIDAYDGVNHVQVLENLAALDRDGGYLGALSIPGSSREAALYREAVADAQAAQEVLIERPVPVVRGNQTAVGAAGRSHVGGELEPVDHLEQRLAVDGGHDGVDPPIGEPADGERDEVQARGHDAPVIGPDPATAAGSRRMSCQLTQQSDCSVAISAPQPAQTRFGPSQPSSRQQPFSLRRSG
jgi:hypothetical protein